MGALGLSAYTSCRVPAFLDSASVASSGCGQRVIRTHSTLFEWTAMRGSEGLAVLVNLSPNRLDDGRNVLTAMTGVDRVGKARFRCLRRAQFDI